MLSLEDRLDRIEFALEAAERRARRWRWTAASLAAALVVGALGAFAASPFADLVEARTVRANRLEIVRGDGKVVLLAAESAGAGQLDLWSASGANTARVSSPASGGDLVLFNDKGRMVFGAYANPHGGLIEAFRTDGTVGVRAGVSDAGSAVSVVGGNGKEVLFAGTDRSGAGAVRVAEPGGRTAATMLVGPGGGMLETSTRSGRPATVIGANSNGASGVIQLSGSGDKPVCEIDVKDDGGARMMLGSTQGTTNLVLEANGQDTGLVSCFTAGRRVLAFGSGMYGGQVNLIGADGQPVMVLGPVSDGHGGSISVRGADGQQVVRCGVDARGDGEVTVYSANGQTKRVINTEP
ncbi:MAG: hypothetical protein FJ253_00265 [Phycisphaerae bacterium]|nr:hypothetical protein [Phycisphaerae bacterium]